MPNKTRIQTSFLEKQAKENSRQDTSRSVMLGVAVVAVIAIAFGAFKAVELLMGFQTYQHVRNVALLLNSPKLEGKDAYIDVTIRNGNAYPVADPVFKILSF